MASHYTGWESVGYNLEEYLLSEGKKNIWLEYQISITKSGWRGCFKYSGAMKSIWGAIRRCGAAEAEAIM